MKIDVSINPIGATAADIIATACAAEKLGFDGVVVFDELSDVVQGETWSHDPWTLMSAAAAVTERISIGSLVLNIANRDAHTLAVAAASLQDLSQGRLWLGVGAGTGADSPFSADQRALGRTPAGPAERRRRLVSYLDSMREVWAAGDRGFLVPEPLPPLVVGAFGPRTAKLAGRHADGIAAPTTAFGDNATSLEDLVDIARRARRDAGRVGEPLIVAHYGWGEEIDDPRWRVGGAVYDRLAAVGASRLVLDSPASPDLLRRVAQSLPLPA